jgi:hypothetical protein
MSLANSFIKYLENDNVPGFNKFKGKLSVTKGNGTLGLIVHVFDSSEYSLDELQALQSTWVTFVPMDHVGFTAAPLVIVGTRLHADVMQGGWITEAG